MAVVKMKVTFFTPSIQFLCFLNILNICQKQIMKVCIVLTMLAAATSDPTVRKDYRFFSQQPFNILVIWFNILDLKNFFQDRVDQRLRGWDHRGAPQEQETAGPDDEAVHGRRHRARRDGLRHRAHGPKKNTIHQQFPNPNPLLLYIFKT